MNTTKFFMILFVLTSTLLAACGTPTAAPTLVAPTTVASATETVTPMPSPSETPTMFSSIVDPILPGGTVINPTGNAPWIILVGGGGEAWGCLYSKCQSWTPTDRREGFPDTPKWIIIYDQWDSPPHYEIIEIPTSYSKGRIEQDSWIVEDGRYEGIPFEIFMSGGSDDPILGQRLLDLSALAENGKLCAMTDLSPIFRCTPAP